VNASSDDRRRGRQVRVSRSWVHRSVQRRHETGGEIGAPADAVSRARPGQRGPFARLGRGAAGSDLGGPAGGTAHQGESVVDLARARSLGVHGQKKVHADEQRRPDVRAARRLWRDGLPLRDAHQYVFLDESGITTDLLRRYGRSPRGTRLGDHAPCRSLGGPHRDCRPARRPGGRGRGV